jgi:hypothetical protein
MDQQQKDTTIHSKKSISKTKTLTTNRTGAASVPKTLFFFHHPYILLSSAEVQFRLKTCVAKSFDFQNKSKTFDHRRKITHPNN